MKKIVRRISLAILTVMMVVLTPQAVSAVEETRVAINVQVPEDWTNPCVWAWDTDGNNAFSAWPGGEMEANPSNDGWYYIWLPNWATHVIVNANEGSVQTDELILDGTNAWITITADGAEISYDAMTEGETPAYVEKFTIYAKVDETWENPSLWAWLAPDGTNAFESWPGAVMKAGETGWYSVKAPIWVNSIIINANEGTIQTADITIDPADVWVTVQADGTFDFSYTDPDQAAVPNITVSIMAPADWATPNLWAWSAPDGTNVYTTWPGEPLAEGENGWLTKEIPGWVNSIIVNGNEGTVQTTDIAIDTGVNTWIVVTGPDAFEVYYEEPVIEASAEVEETPVVVEEPVQEEVEVMEETPESSSSNLLLYIVGGVIVVALIAVAVVVINKKRNNK